MKKEKVIDAEIVDEEEALLTEETELDDFEENDEEKEEEESKNVKKKDGFFKSTWKFIKKHKTPIIAGIATIGGVILGVELASGKKKEESYDGEIHMLPSQSNDSIGDQYDKQVDSYDDNDVESDNYDREVEG